MEEYRFYSSCINWPNNKLKDLNSMIADKKPITRKTFLSHVDREQLDNLAKEMGYAKHPRQGLTMAGDWHISYYCSKI